MTSVTEPVILSAPTAPTAPTRKRAAVIARSDHLTRACVAGTAIGFVPFVLVLWDFGFRPMRRMTASGLNADFFDVQARALFDGHLDVPAGSLGIEAFVVDGRHYMYFGPFLALLRMPVLLLTDRLDGRLTALSMLVGWFVLAAAVTVMVRRVRWQLRGDAPVGRFEAIAIAAVVTTVTGGSTVVYLASQPWVYHEVYIWSTALTIATVACLVATWDDPNLRRVALIGALALATMLTRATAGWAMAIAVIATGTWFLITRRDRGRSWRAAGLGLVAAGTATLAVGSLVNWAKFRHPYRFPIGDQVWTRLSAHRRFVIADAGGDLDGLQFVWTTLTTYFRPDGVRLVPIFPFITRPAEPPTPIGGVLLDESLRTGSIPALMPLLFLLTLWGVVVAVSNPRSAAMRIPLLGCMVMTGGVIAFGHVSQRYTSEFLPLLAVGATIGCVDIARRIHPESAGLRRGLLAGMCALAVFGVAANAAVGLVNSRQHWRGDRLGNLLGVQLAVSSVTGHPLADRIRLVDSLPERGRADDIAVVGDCDAVFVGTGEINGSWVAVDHRDQGFRLHVSDAGARPGSTSLVWFRGHSVRRLQVQVNLDGQLRLVMIGARPVTSGHWLDVVPGETIDVVVSGDTEANRFVATATGAGGERSTVVAPMTEWNRQFRSVAVVPHVALNPPSAERIGLRVATSPGAVPELCDRLRQHA